MHAGPMPEWAKVKIAAVVGIGGPAVVELFVKLGAYLDLVIKLGQVGVAVVTIIYIIKKIKAKNVKQNEDDE